MLSATDPWTIAGVAVALWFAIGTYQNVGLDKIHRRLDRLFEELNGLREYLYEIDPQFDEERALLADLMAERGLFAGLHHMDLIKRKKAEGKRTLNTPFSR